MAGYFNRMVERFRHLNDVLPDDRMFQPDIVLDLKYNFTFKFRIRISRIEYLRIYKILLASM